MVMVNHHRRLVLERIDALTKALNAARYAIFRSYSGMTAGEVSKSISESSNIADKISVLDSWREELDPEPVAEAIDPDTLEEARE